MIPPFGGGKSQRIRFSEVGEEEANRPSGPSRRPFSSTFGTGTLRLRRRRLPGPIRGARHDVRHHFLKQFFDFDFLAGTLNLADENEYAE